MRQVGSEEFLACQAYDLGKAGAHAVSEWMNAEVASWVKGLLPCPRGCSGKASETGASPPPARQLYVCTWSGSAHGSSPRRRRGGRPQARSVRRTSPGTCGMATNGWCPHTARAPAPAWHVPVSRRPRVAPPRTCSSRQAWARHVVGLRRTCHTCASGTPSALPPPSLKSQSMTSPPSLHLKQKCSSSPAPPRP
eukprot:scaffold59269_cov28-Tisochrysis_lutea.AAC.3